MVSIRSEVSRAYGQSMGSIGLSGLTGSEESTVAGGLSHDGALWGSVRLTNLDAGYKVSGVTLCAIAWRWTIWATVGASGSYRVHTVV